MIRLPSRSKHETCLHPVFPTRRYVCPHCQSQFEAAIRALTLKCPSCAKPIQFQDIVFHRASAETLTTLGTVRITRRGSLQGSVNCSGMMIEGMMIGTARVRGRVTIGSKATVNGVVHAHSLDIQPGARMRGTLNISPPIKKPISSILIESQTR